MRTIPALLMAFSALLTGSAASQVPPSGANKRTGDSASRPNILVILAPNDAAFAGMNLLPLLTGKAKAEPRTLIWRFPMRSLWAVRQGDFKLVKEWPRGQSKESSSQKQPEAKNKIGLYQLTTDIAENNDLSASQPEKRKKLRSAFDAWTASLPSQHTEGKASKEE